MSRLKVCFIGMGSIAKRHVYNLLSIRQDVCIDVMRSGYGKELDSILEKNISTIYYSIQELPSDYDIIFITNPTSMHFKTLLEVKDKAKSFFIEKPIFETGNEDISDLPKDKTYYVACPLRYTNVIQYLKNNVNFDEVYSMRCISSSYLPDWRLGVDYRNTYSAHKEMGGGVSIDLIHEWDYIHYLIGSPQKIFSIIKQKSKLELDSDDIAIYIGEYKDKVVELHLDYFGRKAIRQCQLFCIDDTITADLVEQKITFEKSGKVIDLVQDRDGYQKRELEHFLEIIDGRCESDNDIEEAMSILRIARGEL